MFNKISNLQSAISNSADAILAVVLSPSCAVCDRLLDQPTRGPVCPACWASILPLTPPLCDQCGDPLPTWRAISVPLGRCPRSPARPPLAHTAPARRRAAAALLRQGARHRHL